MDQEDQYNYPYHYLPELSSSGFRQHRYWSWGYRYLGRLKVVFDLIRGLEFDSLLDIGCGDGRFLRDLAEHYPGKKLSGIDISEKALTLARQMNPGLHFKQCDILASSMDSQWDIITLLEVIEHIPPKSLPDFMREISRLLRPGGHLIITVPHINEKLIDKHYRHFDVESLRSLIPENLVECRLVLFDDLSIFLRIILKIMGGSGRFFIITHQRLNNFLYNYYINKCFQTESENRCRKIAFMARKK